MNEVDVMRANNAVPLMVGVLIAVAVGTVGHHPAIAQERILVFGSDEDRDAKRETTAVTSETATALRVPTVVATSRPRLEVHIRSVQSLLRGAQSSKSSSLLAFVSEFVRAAGDVSSEGVDVEEASGLLKQVGGWPDTSIVAGLFASDMEGRPRWAIRVDWPVSAIRERIGRLLSSDVAGTVLEGVGLSRTSDGIDRIELNGSDLAYIFAGGPGETYIASHRGLRLSTDLSALSAELLKGQSALIAAKYDLTATEEDSGATFFSNVHFVTSVEYVARVEDDGNWREVVHVRWPPLTGLGAKTLALGRVKQRFFVPEEAFGAMTIRPLAGPAMIESMAGLGPQMVVEDSGEYTMIGEAVGGPIKRLAGSDLCLTVLPGVGFLPVPDFVVQMRMKHPDTFVEEVRAATTEINEAFRVRDQRQPWNEVQVGDRAVFWSDGQSMLPGTLMPFALRPVLFTTSERDAKDKDRAVLVAGWTSTSPERFVRRWLNLPRGAHKRFVPDRRKTNGQAWINWRRTYRRLVPYANLAIQAVTADVLLPSMSSISNDLTDAMVTLKVRYAGMTASHLGPIPIGAVVLPAMRAAAALEDDAGDTDLARERLAARRLKVLYHQCSLFRKDHDRLPAEIAELDGYVDFDGHPELLQLELSSRKKWSNVLDGLFTSSDDDDEKNEDEDDEQVVDIDDKLFAIQWGRETWRLELVPGTLEHLETLYIDQDGKIHRVVKKEALRAETPVAPSGGF